MGNYYEGHLTFYFKKDIPKDLLLDLYKFNQREIKKEQLTVLRDTKWIQHERFNYPSYYTYKEDSSDSYVFCVDFYMKGYLLGGNDLGESICDVLKPYLDEQSYDMSAGGFIGRICDEDDSYDKSFYINDEFFKKEMERRSYICNKDCWYFWDKRLCDRYKWCERVYKLGRESVYKGR